MSTASLPFLDSVRDAGEAAQRADRIALAELVGALAAGRRPTLDASSTAALLGRLNMPAESLEELVGVRQRLDALREQAGREAELREHLRETSASYAKTLAEIQEQEQALRARRTAAEGELARARADVEAVGAAARGAADATGELLRLLAPNLEHDLRVAGSGIKVASGKATGLRQRIEQTEGELAATSDNTSSRPELKAAKITALEESLTAMRKELAEVEEQHDRARREREALATEAAALVGEEGGR